MTTDLILPPGLTLPPGVSAEKAFPRSDETEEELTAEQRGRTLPEPTGWRILCMVPPAKDLIDGTSLNLVKAAETIKVEEQTTAVLFVLKVGPLAFKDPAKFGPDCTPWCKEGDFILVRTYTGTRFKVFGREFRLLNDDQVDAVVSDPRGITRA
jgi:hypothetical protein